MPRAATPYAAATPPTLADATLEMTPRCAAARRHDAAVAIALLPDAAGI